MYEAFIQNIPPEQMIDVTEKYTLNSGDNEFMQISQNSDSGYQQISSKLLMILTNHQLSVQYSILASLDDTMCVRISGNALEHIEKHRHNYIEMVYLLDGELDFLIEDKHCRYHKGEVCLINQNVRHREIPFCAYEALYFSFSGSFLKELQRREFGSHLDDFIFRNTRGTTDIDYLEFFPLKEDVEGRLDHMCFDMFNEIMNKEAGYVEFVYGYLKRILDSLQDPQKYNTNHIRYPSENKEDLFERTIAYIQTHRYKVDRAELAAALHYNGNYISEVFHKKTGVTLAAYIRNMCLQEAANYLLNTDLTVTEIVSLLHYENRTAFYQLFKTRYGVSPSEYQKKTKMRDRSLSE